MRSTILFIFLMANSSLLFGQKQYNIEKAISVIEIDGVINEPQWEETEIASSFFEHFPNDSTLAKGITEVRMTFDDNFIYVAAKCYDENGRYISQSLKRDRLADLYTSDAFAFQLDPIGQMSNGYYFAVNSSGAQVEATIALDGNQTLVNESWDNKWFSAVQQNSNNWSIEMAIPFNSLRYDPGKTKWRLNFIRQEAETNITSSWSQIPRNFNSANLTFNGDLNWGSPLPKNKGNIALIPYALGNSTRDYISKEASKTVIDFGMDTKMSISSSLNIDMAINPDFSQVDVDRQVINLSRFNLFFPERRSFFLENGDLFSNFGSFEVRPFFSRSIGLENGRTIPILYGARLSGNINNTLRIGVMNLQTKDEAGEGSNYSAVAFQQQIFKRSQFKGLFTNRETFSNGDYIQARYNRTIGAEIIQLSKNGQLSSQLKFHKSFQSDFNDNRSYLFGAIFFNNRSISSGVRFTSVDENFVAGSGFSPRLLNYDSQRDTLVRIGYLRNNAWFRYNFFTKKENHPIVSHGPNFWTLLYLNQGGQFNDLTQNVSYHFTFRNFNKLDLRTRFNSTQLFFPTSFVANAEPLPVGRYSYNNFSVSYSSQRQKSFYYDFNIKYGEFYNGTEFSLGISNTWRIQPWGNFGINYNYSKLEFPSRFGERELHLISPRSEISFSNSLFWTTFIQFNTQSENFNLNSRIQWRYSPMSDLFIVYSDNYATTGFTKKSRAIVIKLTYWFNT